MSPVKFESLQILIVDGKRANAKLLRGLLEGLGVRRITILENSTAALDGLRGTAFDVVFCDDAVRPLSSAQFLTALRKDAAVPCVPVILMSAAPQKRQVEIARDSGVNDFIALPLSVATVKNKLASVLLAPKPFISSDAFSGPDRRRRAKSSNGSAQAVPPLVGAKRKWHRRSSDPTA
jgi:CheY-like chemotaxis protein